jgi:hypothetical protein
LNLAVLRFGQGGLILFICLFICRRDFLKVKKHDLPFLVLLGATRFISAQLRNQRQKRRDIMAFAPTRMQLKSDAFKQDTLIPSRFTGEGEDVSPALAWD